MIHQLGRRQHLRRGLRVRRRLCEHLQRPPPIAQPPFPPPPVALPNPSSGAFTLVLPDGLATVTVIDALGRLAFQTAEAQGTVQWELPNPGPYILLVAPAGTTSQRLPGTKPSQYPELFPSNWTLKVDRYEGLSKEFFLDDVAAESAEGVK